MPCTGRHDPGSAGLCAELAAACTSLSRVPRFWLWTQVAIVVFVLAGGIIALTKI